MKLSLTFEPFVKPMYKDFCIQKIQQTVSQIKRHFKFSKKQNIYQSSPLPKQTHNKPIISHSAQHPMDRTVKNSFFQKEKSNYGSRTQSPQKFQISDYQAQTAQKKSRRSRNSSHQFDYGVSTQEKLQKEQLIEFLQKVEQTMQSHTEFYNNIIKKTELMNKKQLNLQKMISQLNNLVAQKKIKHLRLHTFSSQQKSDRQGPLPSVTFRNSKFIDKETQNQQRQISTSANASNKYPSQLSFKPTISKFQNFIKTQESKPLTTMATEYSEQKQLLASESNQNTKVGNIAQNADFLISFMRLQQQFNKIKKKSQYNEFQQLMKVQTL